MSDDPRMVAKRIVIQVLTEAARGEGPKADAAKAELQHRFRHTIRAVRKVQREFETAFKKVAAALKPTVDAINKFQEQLWKATEVKEFDEYSQGARATAIYPGQGTFGGLMYLALKMNGEAGEVAEKVGKIYRDSGGRISDEDRQQIVREIGDVLWYLDRAAAEVGSTLGEAATVNAAKLRDRAVRGALQGSGDDR